MELDLVFSNGPTVRSSVPSDADVVIAIHIIQQYVDVELLMSIIRVDSAKTENWGPICVTGLLIFL